MNLMFSWLWNHQRTDREWANPRSVSRRITVVCVRVRHHHARRASGALLTASCCSAAGPGRSAPTHRLFELARVRRVQPRRVRHGAALLDTLTTSGYLISHSPRRGLSDMDVDLVVRIHATLPPIALPTIMMSTDSSTETAVCRGWTRAAWTSSAGATLLCCVSGWSLPVEASNHAA
jgi:hypothetical protein